MVLVNLHIASSRARLFEDASSIGLKLSDAQQLDNGVVAWSYEKVL
jgi:hypothetical protein